MLVKPGKIGVLKNLNIRSQRVENLRGRLGLRKLNLRIEPILYPLILPLIFVSSRKLNSLQLSFLIILPRDKCAASILCFAELGLALLKNLLTLAVKFK